MLRDHIASLRREHRITLKRLEKELRRYEKAPTETNLMRLCRAMTERDQAWDRLDDYLARVATV